MNTITLNGKTYTAPSSWNEFTERHLRIWAVVCSKQISQNHALMLTAILFYGIPKRVFFKLDPGYQFDIVDTIKFVCLRNDLVRWIFPSLHIRFKCFTGPENRLANSTIKEFRATEMYYHAWRKSKDEKYLDMLIATLYRPKGFNALGNDERVQLTDIRVRKHAPAMAKLAPATRRAILFNYEGCQGFICRKYPLIFKPGGDGAQGLPDMEGLIKIIAGGKFGSFQEAETTPLYLFLDDLSDKIEESEKRK